MMHKPSLATLLLFGSITTVGCEDQEALLSERATFVCSRVRLDEPDVSKLPEEGKGYLSPDASTSADKKDDDDKDKPTEKKEAPSDEEDPGTKQTVAAAINEARYARLGCQVASVQIQEQQATVTVEQSLPSAEVTGEQAIALRRLKDHDERVAKATEFLASAELHSKKVDLPFERTADGWMAKLPKPDTDAKLKAAAARQKKMRALQQEAERHSKLQRLEELTQDLVSMAALDPDTGSILESLEGIEQLKKQRVGRWFFRTSKDKMTDLENSFAFVPSVAEMPTKLGTKVPLLYARCKSRELELYIAFDTVLAPSGWGVDTTVRLDTAPAEAVFMSRNDSGFDTTFFPQPKKWVTRMIAQDTKRMFIEVTLHGGNLVVVEFDTSGAAKNLQRLVAACQ